VTRPSRCARPREMLSSSRWLRGLGMLKTMMSMGHPVRGTQSRGARRQDQAANHASEQQRSSRATITSVNGNLDPTTHPSRASPAACRRACARCRPASLIGCSTPRSRWSQCRPEARTRSVRDTISAGAPDPAVARSPVKVGLVPLQTGAVQSGRANALDTEGGTRVAETLHS
jgi:hypothetical protein